MSTSPTRGRLRRYAAAALLCVAVVALLHAAASTQKPALDESDPDALHVNAGALNRTLGFQRIYAIRDGAADKVTGALDAVVRLLDIEVHYIEPAGHSGADKGARQHGFSASTPHAGDIAVHAQIYADMVRRDIQTALIVTGDSDMELDIKVRLASALEGTSPHLIDLLVVGRTLSDPAEPEAHDMLALLRQTDGASDLSAQMQQRWAKRGFLHRSAILFPSPAPRGVHAYALNARMARRLHQRMSQQAISDSPSLDSLLADAVADGQCTAYSVSPPLIVARASQFLRRSVRHAIGARDDDPAQYPPFVDWQELWT